MRNVISVNSIKGLQVYSNKKKVFDKFRDVLNISYMSFCRKLSDDFFEITTLEKDEIFPITYRIEQKMLL